MALSQKGAQSEKTSSKSVRSRSFKVRTIISGVVFATALAITAISEHNPTTPDDIISQRDSQVFTLENFDSDLSRFVSRVRNLQPLGCMGDQNADCTGPISFQGENYPENLNDLANIARIVSSTHPDQWPIEELFDLWSATIRSDDLYVRRISRSFYEIIKRENISSALTEMQQSELHEMLGSENGNEQITAAFTLVDEGYNPRILEIALDLLPTRSARSLNLLSDLLRNDYLPEPELQRIVEVCGQLISEGDHEYVRRFVERIPEHGIVENLLRNHGLYSPNVETRICSAILLNEIQGGMDEETFSIMAFSFVERSGEHGYTFNNNAHFPSVLLESHFLNEPYCDGDTSFKHTQIASDAYYAMLSDGDLERRASVAIFLAENGHMDSQISSVLREAITSRGVWFGRDNTSLNQAAERALTTRSEPSRNCADSSYYIEGFGQAATVDIPEQWITDEFETLHCDELVARASAAILLTEYGHATEHVVTVLAQTALEDFSDFPGSVEMGLTRRLRVLATDQLREIIEDGSNPTLQNAAKAQISKYLASSSGFEIALYLLGYNESEIQNVLRMRSL